MKKWEIVHNYSDGGEQECDSLATFIATFDDAVSILYAFCDYCGIDGDDVIVDREHGKAYGESSEEEESVMLVEVKTEE